MDDLVRKSKFKFITGKPWGSSKEHRDAPVGRNSVIRTNGEYFAIPHSATGLLSYRHVDRTFGKFPDASQRHLFTIEAHNSRLIDFDFEPFAFANRSSPVTRLLTAGANEIKLWSLKDDEPGSGIDSGVRSRYIGTAVAMAPQAQHELLCHLVASSGVTHACFHPLVSGLVISGHQDKTLALWDMEEQKVRRELQDAGSLDSVSFGHASGGHTMLTSARDTRTIRLWDLRAKSPLIGQVISHESAKPSHVIYMDMPFHTLFSVGFSRQGDREIRVWDQRMIGSDESVAPRAVQTIDNGSSVLQPFYDQDVGLIFLAGKGDHHISWYEIDDDGIHYLNKYDSGEPQASICMFPKLRVDVNRMELQRALKLHNDNRVETISFVVPRKDSLVEYFQEDIFPATWNGKPTCSANAFFEPGNQDRTFLPELTSLKPKDRESIYDVHESLGGKKRPEGGSALERQSSLFFRKLTQKKRGEEGGVTSGPGQQEEIQSNEPWTWQSVSWTALRYTGIGAMWTLWGVWMTAKFIGYTAPVWAYKKYQERPVADITETVTVEVVDKATGRKVVKQVERVVVRQRITDETSAKEHGTRLMRNLPLPISPDWLKRVLPDSVKSAFEEIDLIDVKNGKQPVMFHVKGRRNLRVTQIQAHVDSLASNDCFVIDLGKVIFLWFGEKANRIERAGCLDLASKIKSKERGNAGIRIVQLEEGKIPQNIVEKRLFEQDFCKALKCSGFDNRARREEATSVYDEEWHLHVDQRQRLYMIDRSVVERLSQSDQQDEQEIRQLQEQLLQEIDLMGKRPSHKVLKTTECYILDASDNEVWVWTGKAASPSARKWAIGVGRLLADHHARKHGWAAMTRAFESGEPAVLKDKFSDFPGVGLMIETKRAEQGAFIAPKKEQHKIELQELLMARRSLNRTTSHSRPPVEEITIWRVANFEREKYPLMGHFFSRDTYIIRYSYEKIVGGKRHHKIFYWQGRDAHRKEKGTQAFKTVEVADELGSEHGGGYAVQIRVVQGKEQKGFLRIFQDRYMVHKGAFCAQWHSSNEVRMYAIRGSSLTTAHAVQTDRVERSHLHSYHAALIISDGASQVFCWIGRYCPQHERDACMSAARSFMRQCGIEADDSIFLQEEGGENAEFWKLFPADDYSKAVQVDHPPHNDPSEQSKLFVIDDYTGAIEIHDVCQIQHMEMKSPRPGKVEIVRAEQARRNSLAEGGEGYCDVFNESDLDNGKAYLLDDPSRKLLFVWIGTFANSNVKKFALKACLEYAKLLQIDDANHCFVEREGQESTLFKSCFHAWSDETTTAIIRAKRIQEMKRTGEKMASSPSTTTRSVQQLYDLLANSKYPYSRLVQEGENLTRALPEGVDKTQLEQYLEDTEFEKVFKITRAEFEKMPRWKAQNLKKEVKLY